MNSIAPETVLPSTYDSMSEYLLCKLLLYDLEKSEKHWGPRRNRGGKVVGVVPTKFHPNQTRIIKVCYWSGFGVG